MLNIIGEVQIKVTLLCHHIHNVMAKRKKKAQSDSARSNKDAVNLGPVHS
jgi:hypothetical protein